MRHPSVVVAAPSIRPELLSCMSVSFAVSCALRIASAEEGSNDLSASRHRILAFRSTASSGSPGPQIESASQEMPFCGPTRFKGPSATSSSPSWDKVYVNISHRPSSSEVSYLNRHPASSRWRAHSTRPKPAPDCLGPGLLGRMKCPQTSPSKADAPRMMDAGNLASQAVRSSLHLTCAPQAGHDTSRRDSGW